MYEDCLAYMEHCNWSIGNSSNGVTFRKKRIWFVWKPNAEAQETESQKNSKKLFVRWKGVNKMTVVFAAFMVSIGILGRDSMVCG